MAYKNYHLFLFKLSVLSILDRIKGVFIEENLKKNLEIIRCYSYNLKERELNMIKLLCSPKFQWICINSISIYNKALNVKSI